MKKSILFSSILVVSLALMASVAVAGGFGGNKQGQLQGQLQSQASFYDSSPRQTVVFQEAERLRETKQVIRNNPSVVAPDLTTSNGTCHGSTSAGASGAGAGISFGTTWKDESCNLRYNATTMHEMGYKQVALRIMCQEPTVALAAPEVCGTTTPSGLVANNTPQNGFIGF